MAKVLIVAGIANSPSRYC